MEGFENELNGYRRIEDEIQSLAPSHTVGCLSLNASPLKAYLCSAARGRKEQCAKVLCSQASQMMNQFFQELKEAECCITADVKGDSQEFAKMVEALTRTQTQHSEIEFQLRPVQDMYELLHRCDIPVPEEETV